MYDARVRLSVVKSIAKLFKKQSATPETENLAEKWDDELSELILDSGLQYMYVLFQGLNIERILYLYCF